MFAKVHTERPEISRDFFFAVLGRVMGQTSFANVIPYKKKGKAIGYKYLSYKTEENENSKFKTSQQKKIHKKYTKKKTRNKMCGQIVLFRVVWVRSLAVQP